MPRAAAYVAVATAAAADAELVAEEVPMGEDTDAEADPVPGVWPDMGIDTGAMPEDMDDMTPLLTDAEDTELPLGPWVVWGELYSELLPSIGPTKRQPLSK